MDVEGSLGSYRGLKAGGNAGSREHLRRLYTNLFEKMSGEFVSARLFLLFLLSD